MKLISQIKLIKRFPFLFQPLCADNFPDDLDYADVDFNTYGPINYKAASIYALVKKNQNGNLNDVRK